MILKTTIHLMTILASCTFLSSCIHTHEANYKPISDNKESIQKYQGSNVSINNLPNRREQLTLNNVKYYDYEKYDKRGEPIPVEMTGAAGRFAWENNCLVFISIYGGYRATPILPYGITQWDSIHKVLVIDGTFIQMGDLVETSGMFTETPSNKKGVCWDYPYIVGIGTMGGIKVLESEEDLSYQP